MWCMVYVILSAKLNTKNGAKNKRADGESWNIRLPPIWMGDFFFPLAGQLFSYEFLLFNSWLWYENCLIRHLETHFILLARHPDRQVCGRKWNKYGRSGTSEWLGWHLLWLAFVVVNAFLSSSDSSFCLILLLTFNFQMHADVHDLSLSCIKYNKMKKRKCIYWRTQVQNTTAWQERRVELLPDANISTIFYIYSLKMSKFCELSW